jgi:hypothetical protein
MDSITNVVSSISEHQVVDCQTVGLCPEIKIRSIIPCTTLKRLQFRQIYYNSEQTHGEIKDLEINGSC